MASQTCEQCGAIVAGDEQFCPSCGTFMDPMSAPQPRPRSSGGGNVISVSSDGPSDSPYEEFSLESAPPNDDTPPPPAPKGNGDNGGNVLTCPSCGAVNPANNRHCQECGARLRQGPLPTAPRPAVQATAGVRAALAISGLLLAVILIALFFNFFTGDDPEAGVTSTTTATTVPQPVETGPIEILAETCTPQGISSFICSNLTSGTADEYQVSWEENSEEGITILFTFRVAMAITEIHWVNIEDSTRFQQNYRAQALEIEAQDSVAGPIAVRLEDQQGTQVVQYSSINTTTLTITVIEAYMAELVEDNRFDELAIDEIVVIGRPASPTTETTVPSDDSTSTTADG